MTPGSRRYTLAEVEWWNSTSFDGDIRDMNPLFVVTDVPLIALRRWPHGWLTWDDYYRENPGYMWQLTEAFASGHTPLPVWLAGAGWFDHIDGAHRAAIAAKLGQPTIRSFVSSL